MRDVLVKICNLILYKMLSIKKAALNKQSSFFLSKKIV